MALASAGFTVDAVCPSRHSLRELRSVRRAYSHYGVAPADTFADAIRSSSPDLIIPCDDLAATLLRQLYAEETRGNTHSPVAALIERSLGSPESFQVLYHRAAFIEMARRSGVRVPVTATIRDLNELEDWARVGGFPAVLKADNTSGGEGVRIVSTLEEARRAFTTLSAPPLAARAAKRALLDQDSSLVRPSLFRRRAGISAQIYIRGREATTAVACWNGSVLASLHFEVINKMDVTGHSTVLRRIDNADMATATEKVVRGLGLSGVIGLDFILQADTWNAYLIEINPRATQVGHLRLGPDRDIPAALFSCVSGRPIQEADKITENEVIALFPQEWKRDPASPYLRSGYHDVPWDEPELVRACVRSRRRQWARYAEQHVVRTMSPAHVSRD